jgi:hypothetical protein
MSKLSIAGAAALSLALEAGCMSAVVVACT